MPLTIICHAGRAQKTLQYGFDLQQAVDARSARRPFGPHRTPALLAETRADMYACGFLPPHHPLPALRRPQAAERL